ncbi:MAG: diphthamide biosynthesis enzyme Dph2 [Sulfolobales archaeon]|nr:diphthamide biosynthesis enzyme Dph2 [Sulfolobales archaeon]MCX8199135.1 diphthamide biosynthesis enzyme Dph2 [Sulfolobales archaeon]MDW8170114.1 diphthamide biosynthesis enzyme Dph2 [Desulfurococcaceae archaeon]
MAVEGFKSNDLYDLGFNELREFIEENKPRRLLVQLPDGLKFLALNIVSLIKSIDSSIEVYLSSDPSYGACTLALEDAITVGADALIHFGHIECPLAIKPSIPVLYIPAYYLGKLPEKSLEKLLEEMHLSKDSVSVVIVASTQYVKLVEELRKVLENLGCEVIVPSGGPYPGLVIGCNYSSIPVGSSYIYVVISSGYFHATGLCLHLGIDARVLLIDVARDELINMSRECRKILAKRMYLVSQLINNPVKRVALIVGQAIGQYRPALVKLLEEKLKEKGIDVVKVVARYLSLNELIALDQGVKADAYVVTSCPRLPIDDLASFHKPVITPGEALMVVSESLKYLYPW